MAAIIAQTVVSAPLSKWTWVTDGYSVGSIYKYNQIYNSYDILMWDFEKDSWAGYCESCVDAGRIHEIKDSIISRIQNGEFDSSEDVIELMFPERFKSCITEESIFEFVEFRLSVNKAELTTMSNKPIDDINSDVVPGKLCKLIRKGPVFFGFSTANTSTNKTLKYKENTLVMVSEVSTNKIMVLLKMKKWKICEMDCCCGNCGNVYEIVDYS
tara:strand:+ start:40 stop:678 length:639 start_codon:yes stop_codon:yes gene_type:complete